MLLHTVLRTEREEEIQKLRLGQAAQADFRKELELEEGPRS